MGWTPHCHRLGAAVRLHCIGTWRFSAKASPCPGDWTVEIENERRQQELRCKPVAASLGAEPGCAGVFGVCHPPSPGQRVLPVLPDGAALLLSL